MDATHSEESLKYSLKKYFIEGLKTQGVYSSFRYQYMDMKDALDTNLDSWIVFKYGGSRIVNIIKDVTLSIFVFSRGSQDDFAEDLLSSTRDKLFSLLHDEGQDDMVARVPLFDINTKEQKGSMMLLVRRESEDERAYDKTFYRNIVVDVVYAVK